MNIRNTLFPLALMTLLCLHFQAAVVWGSRLTTPNGQVQAELFTETAHVGRVERGEHELAKLDETAAAQAPTSVADRRQSRGEVKTTGAEAITPPAHLMRLDPNGPGTRGGLDNFKLTDSKGGGDDDSRRRLRSDDRRGRGRSSDDSNREFRDDGRRGRGRSSDDSNREFRDDGRRGRGRSSDDFNREFRDDGRRGRGRSSDDFNRQFRSWDDSRHRQQEFRGSDRNRTRVVKHVVHHIPSRHAVILHGRDRYHYYSGRFYRPWHNGFILVRPPIGLVVLNIPLGSRIFVSAGITYHVFGDVYYRRVPAGYQVVEPIRTHSRAWPERVEVVTDMLNVRYGPETNEAVIAQVDRYTILRVLGSAPGWLYVEVEGEDLRGWVMERYVSSTAARG